MRFRASTTLILLAVPAMLAAQSGRTRRGGVVGRPPTTAPKPPLAPGLHDQRMFYRASRFSMEAYPMYAFVRTSDDGAGTWAMPGGGTRLDYRFRPMVSFTADLVSAMMLGPYRMYAGELGVRLGPERSGQNVRPFFDVRTSWASTREEYDQQVPIGGIAGPPQQNYSGYTTGDGFGLYSGFGIESAVTRSLAITSGIGVARHLMSGVRTGSAGMGTATDFNTTMVRFTIGLSYNPQRLIRQ
jgi:hypothetical protein